MKRAFLGELEEVVLLTVAALQETAYCALITQTIDQQMARSISFPTIHTSLKRLEEKGFRLLPDGRSNRRARGRRKRLFEVTALVSRALQDVQELWQLVPLTTLRLGDR